MDNKQATRSPIPNAWVRVKEFSDPSGLVVSISRNDTGRGRPKFNIEVGEKSRDGQKTLRFLGIRSEGQGKVNVVRIAGTIARLVNEAENYIENEVQLYEDQYMDERVAREQKQLDRDKPKPQMGLKNLAKRDAATKKAEPAKTEAA